MERGKRLKQGTVYIKQATLIFPSPNWQQKTKKKDFKTQKK